RDGREASLVRFDFKLGDIRGVGRRERVIAEDGVSGLRVAAGLVFRQSAIGHARLVGFELLRSAIAAGTVALRVVAEDVVAGFAGVFEGGAVLGGREDGQALIGFLAEQKNIGKARCVRAVERAENVIAAGR